MKILAALAVSLVTAAFPAFGASTAGPTDPQIAAIVVAANQVDIDAGQLAAAQTSNPDIRSFAQLMVKDHSGVNKAATDLVTRLKVTPESNATSESLQSGGKTNIEHLKTLKGAAFDKAYIDNEVAYHEAVLNAVDTVLIPNAKNADLKALLVKVRPAFVAHLAHARMLQQKTKAS